jgi:hypothetical protein
LKEIGGKIRDNEVINEDEREYWFKFKRKGKRRSKCKEMVCADSQQELQQRVKYKRKEPPDKPSNVRVKRMTRDLYKIVTSKNKPPMRMNMLREDRIFNTEVCSKLVNCTDILKFLVSLVYLFSDSCQFAAVYESKAGRRPDIERKYALGERQR